MIENPFFKTALIAAILSSIPFGILGTYVTARRINYLVGAVAHSVLAGIGIALFLKYNMGIHWLTPFKGALAAAVISALAVSKAGTATKNNDSAIGAVWAVGMAVGLIFLSKTNTNTDPMSYLFGNVLFISKNDIVWTTILAALSVAFHITSQKKLAAVCFDETFAKARGINTLLYTNILLIFTALATVVLMQIVGIILVIAMFTLPPAVAALIGNRFSLTVPAAVILALVFNVVGLQTAWKLDLPAGPAMVAVGGLFYLAALTLFKLKRKNTNT